MLYLKHVRQLFVFLVLFPVAHSLYAQNTSDVLFTGKENQIPLSSFFIKVEQSYPVKFYFKPEWLDKYKVDVNATNKPLNEVLDRLLYDKPYVYKRIQGNNFVILPKDKLAMLYGQMVDKSGSYGDFTTTVVGNLNESGKFKSVTVKGQVHDGKNDEPLIGAVIQVENTRVTAVSDHTGAYSLTIAPGIYSLTISSMGYEVASYKIKVVSNGDFPIDLYEKSLKIDEVIISAQRADRNVRSSQMSIVEMDAKSIKRLPSIGEKDVLKSFTMMPGVKSVGEFGSGINVRGGGEDQNLYLIEGAPMFNTAHVFGLISVLNPDAVSNVSLSKGHIPASSGERASSVMDIQLRDNAPKELHARGGVGIFDSRLLFDGPINDKLSFKLGGRYGYPNILLNQTKDYYLIHSKANFYDGNALLNWNFSKNRITAFYYESFDKFKYATELSYQYQSRLGSLTWNRFWSSNFNSSLVLAYSTYGVSKDDLIDTTKRSRLTLQTNYTSGKFISKYTGFEHHALDGGFQLIHYESHPGEIKPLDLISNVKADKLNAQYAYESALFINDNYEINKKITINVGLRYSMYAFVGPYNKANYDAANGIAGEPVSYTSFASGKVAQWYTGLEPRLSLKYQLDDQTSVKTSYNRNRQYIQLLSLTSISTPNDIWKLADPYIKPLIADQAVVGFYRNFLNNLLETSVEAYYKKMQNMQEYRTDALTEMSHHVETELANTKGENYGLELMVKKNTGKFDGWVSYTFSRAFRQTTSNKKEEMINNNRRYASAYDKPNDLTVVGNYHFNKRIVFSANFSYSTGRPINLPEYSALVNGNIEIPVYGDRNKYRLPDYHRLDISLSIDENLRVKRNWRGSWTFSILNVYCRHNPYSVFYKKDTPNNTNNYKMYNTYDNYLIGRFMPVVTYNFIF